MKSYPIIKLIETAEYVVIDGERQCPIISYSRGGRLQSIGFCVDGGFQEADWILVDHKKEAYLINGCINVQAYRPDLGMHEAEELTIELGMIRPLTDADMEA